MARYTEAVCKLCRREGDKLYLKGDRCYTDKCAIIRRKYAPGQHGMARKKMSEYGMQLREKQKVRRYYGILEKQFEKYFEMAASKKGVTGENLFAILESRFDNIICRLGFAVSRAESRQLVRHGHFNLNGKRVNISSILVKPGDVITVREKSASIEKIKENVANNGSKPKVKWLDMDINTMTGKMLAYAEKEDIEIQIQEHLIIELYSK